MECESLCEISHVTILFCHIEKFGTVFKRRKEFYLLKDISQEKRIEANFTPCCETDIFTNCSNRRLSKRVFSLFMSDIKVSYWLMSKNMNVPRRFLCLRKFRRDTQVYEFQLNNALINVFKNGEITYQVNITTESATLSGFWRNLVNFDLKNYNRWRVCPNIGCKFSINNQGSETCAKKGAF
ncbi:hypothetical protein BC833DRAFT_561710 [Globomyces pollinis-pini]|nr:hypothetical protein BC833DRAFT_561710 [Globomyces pollinis-pini]